MKRTLLTLLVLAVSTLVKAQTSNCQGTGSIIWEYWTGIPGREVSLIPLNTPPTATQALGSFVITPTTMEAFGSRVRGYVCPPVTGDYIFYISSDNNGELWLSSSDQPSGKQRIAWVTLSGYNDFTSYPSQQSVVITLQQNQRYYIEALHKENGGGDHLQIAWKKPGDTDREIIPGGNLMPFDANSPAAVPPTVAITSQQVSGSAPASIALTASASDSDGTISLVEFYNGDTKIGEALSSPYTYTWTNVSAGSYTITAKATDNSNQSTTSAAEVVVVNVAPAPATASCAGTGNITWEYWGGIPGNAISQIPLDSPPTATQTLNSFASPLNTMDNYGSRVRGYLCPPVSGDYIFYFTTDDNGELWLSSNDQPLTKQKIAHVDDWAAENQFDRFSSQQSAVITLQQNQRYYIEALQKEGAGGDHIVVAWKKPGDADKEIIPGTSLIPFNAPPPSPAPSAVPTVALTSQQVSGNAPATITLAASALDSDGTISKVEFYNSDTKIGESLNSPYTFSWTNVSAGSYSITVKATDNSGLSATSSVAIVVVNSAPPAMPAVALTSQQVGGNAPATITLTASASDSDGTISKVEFYNGDTKIGEALNSPYTYTWPNVSAGSYSITAKAIDNSGLSTTSLAATVVVNSAEMPTVALTSQQVSGSAPASITLTASASDSDGTISKVEFYNGDTKIGEALNSPYTYTWTNVSAGSYSIAVKAIDNSGLSSTSSAQSVTVGAPSSGQPTADVLANYVDKTTNQTIGGIKTFSNNVQLTNVLVNTTTDDGVNKLQVNGGITATSAMFNGNVGIGTSNPGAKLDIRDGGINVGAAGDDRYLNLYGTWRTQSSATGLWDQKMVGENLAFHYYNGSSWITNRLLLSSNGIGSNGNLAIDGSANSYIMGNVGIGTTSPTAFLHLKAGTAASNSAPIKFTPGANLSTPEANALEWDGTRLYQTSNAGTRNTIAYLSDIQQASSTAYLPLAAGSTSAITGNLFLHADTYHYANTRFGTGKGLYGDNANHPNWLVTSDGWSTNGSIKAATLNLEGALTGAGATFSGNVGIGTANPEYKLHVASTAKFSPASDQSLILSNTSLNSQSTSGETSLYFGDAASGVNMLRASKRTYNTRAFEIWTEHGYNVPSKSADFYNKGINFYTSDVNRLTIDAAGNVGIGTAQPDSKLTVKGKIHAEEVKVDLNVPGPDYVFEKDYDLKSLAQVEQFITENKHLPEIPSAKAMEKDGISMGDMQMKLLQKIEELTLYMIKQNKQSEDQKRQIKDQNERISALEKQLNK